MKLAKQASLFFLLITTSLLSVEKWTPEQILKMKGVSEVHLSPDNRSVVFVGTEAILDGENSNYLCRLYLTDAKGKETPLLLTQAQSQASQPAWSPDGKWIAFLSTREGAKNLYLISPRGGEATALTHGKSSIETFQWSPDSKKIAFVMPETLFTPSQTGYVYEEPQSVNRLWLIDLTQPKLPAEPLTPKTYYVCGSDGIATTTEPSFDWSPSGDAITFSYSPGEGVENAVLHSSIATLDLATRTLTNWEKRGESESMPRYSPDGTCIAYASNSDSLHAYALINRVAIRSKEGRFIRELAPTFNEGPFLKGPNLLGWSADGKSVLYFEPKQTKYHIESIPIDGAPSQEIASGNYFFRDPKLSYDRLSIGCTIEAPDRPPEAYVTLLSPFKPVQLSHFNDQELSLPLPKTEVITWVSGDGEKIEGLLTYPIGYKKGTLAPLLVIIHGGPMAFFDHSFAGTPYPYPFLSFAEEGYLVFKPNPRGSCGYGKNFRCANVGDWGGEDFHDIMAGVNALIHRNIADPARMGVMGWSYGGYMTAWIITQTNRFQAASMGAGLSDLISMAGTTDVRRFMTDYFLDNFWKNPCLYQERSPIYYVKNVETPCLIQHGTNDVRVPVAQSYEFYHALKTAHKEAVLVLYPGMGHGFNNPAALLDAMERNLKWFRSYIPNS